jgi:hypothetical protein
MTSGSGTAAPPTCPRQEHRVRRSGLRAPLACPCTPRARPPACRPTPRCRFPHATPCASAPSSRPIAWTTGGRLPAAMHVAGHLLEHQRRPARPLRRVRGMGSEDQSAVDEPAGPAPRNGQDGCRRCDGLQADLARHPCHGAIRLPMPPSTPSIAHDRPQLGPDRAGALRTRRHASLRDRRRTKDPLAQSVRALYLVHLDHGGGHEQLRRRRQRLCRQPRSEAGGGPHPEPRRRLARCREEVLGGARRAVLHAREGLHRRHLQQRHLPG